MQLQAKQEADDLCANLLTQLMQYAQKLEIENATYKSALEDAEDKFRHIAKTDDFYNFLLYAAEDIRDITDKHIGINHDRFS